MPLQGNNLKDKAAKPQGNWNLGLGRAKTLRQIELLDQPIPEGSIRVTVPCQDDRYSISTGRSACRGREGESQSGQGCLQTRLAPAGKQGEGAPVPRSPLCGAAGMSQPS